MPYDVVATRPQCKTNVSAEHHSVNEFDFVSVDCDVGYRGKWAPDIECQPRGTVVLNNVTDNYVTYKQVIFAKPQILHGHSVVCTVSFTGPAPSFSSGSASSTDLGEPPNNSYTWTSQRIRVTTKSGKRTSSFNKRL